MMENLYERPVLQVYDLNLEGYLCISGEKGCRMFLDADVQPYVDGGTYTDGSIYDVIL